MVGVQRDKNDTGERIEKVATIKSSSKGSGQRESRGRMEVDSAEG